MKGLNIISGERVALVPLGLKFCQPYWKWMNDAEILERTQSTPFPTMKDLEEAIVEWENSDRVMTYIILDKATNSPIGDCALWLKGQQAEFGILIGECPYRRRGYAKEAAMLLLRQCPIFNIHKVYADVLVDNADSLRLTEKLGFVKESILEIEGRQNVRVVKEI